MSNQENFDLQLQQAVEEFRGMDDHDLQLFQQWYEASHDALSEDYVPYERLGIYEKANLAQTYRARQGVPLKKEENQMPEPPQQSAMGLGPLVVLLILVGVIIFRFVKLRKRHLSAGPKKESIEPEILQAIQNGSVRPKSRVGFVLFAIFFGALGIHNFYALRIKSAVAQLLLTLFTGVALGALTGIAFATKWAWWLENGWLVAAIVEPVVILGVWIWSIVEICVVSHDGRGVPMQ